MSSIFWTWILKDVTWESWCCQRETNLQLLPTWEGTEAASDALAHLGMAASIQYWASTMWNNT